MDLAVWAATFINRGEEKITRVVDRILSTNYLRLGRRNAGVQEVIESMEVATRDETDALKEQLVTLQRKVDELTARLEALPPSAWKKKAPCVQ
jgi:hypothetical protein